MTRGVQNFNEVDFGMKDCALEIICKEQIASATDMKHRTRKFLKLYFYQISHRIILDETASLHLHSEGIHLGQILVILRLNHRETFFVKL